MAGHRRRPTVVAAVMHDQRGFALLIVLFTVGFLALLGTQIVAAGRTDTQLESNLKQQAVLEAAAEGAVANATFYMLAEKDPRFQADRVVREVRIGPTLVQIQIENESDRVNLNTASGVLLRALIIDAGGPPTLAGRLSAAILDWRTSGLNPRPGGAKAPAYQAAGRNYGPPGTPFQSVDELQNVLGMTPDLFARLAPHLTIFTDGDPDLSTRDPMVVRALTDAGGGDYDNVSGAQMADPILRISATAVGSGRARYSLVVVVSSNFRSNSPRIKEFFLERGTSASNNK